MNSDFLRWLLNVKAIPKGSDSLQLSWEHPWASWVWVLLLFAAALFAVWSYSHMAGSKAVRGALAAVRFVLFLLVLVLVSGPMLELPRETIEQDWVMMLADRSASMTIRDAADGSTAISETERSASPRQSRDEQLKNALENQRTVFEQLASEKNVVWLGFHGGAFMLNASEKTEATPHPLPDLGEPSGRRTDIEMAIEQALQRAAARPISGIVVFSDGCTSAAPNRALVARLKAEKIPLFVVPLGSAEPLGDLAIRRIESPRRAFVRDKVPVVVEIEGRGFHQEGAAPTIKLVDQASGEVLDEQPLDLNLLNQESNNGNLTVTFTGQPELAGETTWAAIIEQSGGPSDLIPENNSKSFQIELIDRPLRVLYIDGYPRWEYRFVKNLLVREKTVESSVMLISADRDFAQEGNQPITRLPRSPEEFAAFDVIILGDVPSSFFSPAQLEMIRAHVADRGAGLLWIAGPRSLPSTYVGTALADLLPMRGSLKLPAIGEAITMTATTLAKRLGVLQLSLSDETAGWPEQLRSPETGWSRLFYAQRIEPGLLKPAAEILAQTVNNYNGEALPLVINMRYGAGQSMYVATDEIWRWRYGRGELLHEQFWLQMVRMLGRESLSSEGEPATLEVNPRRVAVNQPMRLEIRLLDSQLLQTPRTSIRVALENESKQKVGEIELQRVEGTEDRYAATYFPDGAGEFRVRIDDPTLAGLGIDAPADVFEPDDELQRPEADHEMLRQIAATTEGQVVSPMNLKQLLSLPNRAVKTINPLTEPIWDSPLALMLGLLLLTVEWVGRKILRFA